LNNKKAGITPAATFFPYESAVFPSVFWHHLERGDHRDQMGNPKKVPAYEQAEGKCRETIFLHHALIPADFVLTFIATTFGSKHAGVRTVPLQLDGYSRNPRNT
jgi:hypothetical protein